MGDKDKTTKPVLLHVDPDLYWKFKALAAQKKMSIKALLHEVMDRAVKEQESKG